MVIVTSLLCLMSLMRGRRVMAVLFVALDARVWVMGIFERPQGSEL